MCLTHERSASGSPGHGGTITAAVRALIPSHPACAEALALAKSVLPASILYHSLRVFLYAQAFLAIFQDADSVTLVPPSTADTADDGAPDATAEPASDSGLTTTRSASVVLFVACILHDVSTAADYDAVPERFEVVAADAAVRVLLAHGFPEATARDAWLAMALHTSPGIAEVGPCLGFSLVKSWTDGQAETGRDCPGGSARGAGGFWVASAPGRQDDARWCGHDGRHPVEAAEIGDRKRSWRCRGEAGAGECAKGAQIFVAGGFDEGEKRESRLGRC